MQRALFLLCFMLAAISSKKAVAFSRISATALSAITSKNNYYLRTMASSSNDNTTTETVEKKQKTSIWYFGYGAQCSPTSRGRRNITAVDYKPAILKDFVIDFSVAGVANVFPKAGSEVHGVVMEFDSQEMWDRVVGHESGYANKEIMVNPYQGEPFLAKVVYMVDTDPNQQKEKGRPQERYLKIIAEGMKHHGVDPTYVDTHILGVDCIKSRSMENYLTLPSEDEPLPTISFKEYEARAEKASPPCFLIGRLVVDMVGTLPDTAKTPLLLFLQAKAFGKADFTDVLMEQLYDPDLPKDPSDHWKWAQDQLVDLLRGSDLYSHAKITMRLEEEK